MPVEAAREMAVAREVCELEVAIKMVRTEWGMLVPRLSRVQRSEPAKNLDSGKIDLPSVATCELSDYLAGMTRTLRDLGNEIQAATGLLEL